MINISYTTNDYTNMRVIVRNIYYHNPSCSKSREGLRILESRNLTFDIKHYLEEPLIKDDVHELIELYSGNYKDLIRERECIEFGINVASLTIDSCVAFICQYPIILQRPLLKLPSKVVVGRPRKFFYALV